MSTSGAKGLFRKRPAVITLSAEGFAAELSDVDQLFLNIERYQAGRERALLAKLAPQRSSGS